MHPLLTANEHIPGCATPIGYQQLVARVLVQQLSRPVFANIPFSHGTHITVP